MALFSKTAYRLFSRYWEPFSAYMPDIKNDIKKAKMQTSVEEYFSGAVMISLVAFVFELPIISFIISLVIENFAVGLFTAFTVSAVLAAAFFYLYINYPKTLVMDRRKRIDSVLPFATLYLSTSSGTKLPIDKVFKIFIKYSGYKEIVREVNEINNDIENFGLDTYTALERAAERSPSKKFKELIWGMLSTLRSGGDLSKYLEGKSESFINDYRRKLTEFSRSLTVYTEVYLTAVVLGGVFFTILTAIISGIGGGGGNIIGLQFILVFIFIPAMSWVFITLIKSATPGDE